MKPTYARRTASALVLVASLLLGGCKDPAPAGATDRAGIDPADQTLNQAGQTPNQAGQTPNPTTPSGPTSPAAKPPAAPPAKAPAGLQPARAVPAGAVRVAEFLADCRFSHRLSDDPIVLPGLAGASHSHDFFGNATTNAASTYATLRTGRGNCTPAIDLSSYWVPTLYTGDTAVPPDSATFYYLGEGVSDADRAATRAAPVGLKIVAGNAKATGPNDSQARWSCLHAGQVGASKNFVTCPAGTKLETYLDFPQCWNGRDLDSSDHKSHMSYPVGGHCPASHPVNVPKLRMVLRYPVNGDPSAFRLASGPGYTMHGDFFNAWPEQELSRRVRDCIHQKVKCNANGDY